MDMNVQNKEPVQTLIIINDNSSPLQLHSQKSKIHRTRKILLILLTIMFTWSLSYLGFVGLLCMKYMNLWFCQPFNYSYEFSWSCISLMNDALWLFLTYRYYSKGLVFLSYLSAIFSFIFGISLLLSLLTIFQTMMNFHMIDTHILIGSLGSITLCTVTLVLQLVIVLLSLKLAKLISNNTNSIM